MNDDPREDFIEAIKAWADTALENGEIDDKQYKFVTNIDDTHLAVPKPLYKTHKKDENGDMLDPVPIRTLNSWMWDTHPPTVQTLSIEN